MHFIFFSLANASEGVANQTGSAWMQMVPMLGIFAIFYFFMILPQKKKAKSFNQMIDALKVGDRVVVANSIVGTIKSIEDDIVQLEISNNVVMNVMKRSIVGQFHDKKDASSDKK